MNRSSFIGRKNRNAPSPTDTSVDIFAIKHVTLSLLARLASEAKVIHSSITYTYTQTITNNNLLIRSLSNVLSTTETSSDICAIKHVTLSLLARLASEAKVIHSSITYTYKHTMIVNTILIMALSNVLSTTETSADICAIKHVTLSLLAGLAADAKVNCLIYIYILVLCIGVLS